MTSSEIPTTPDRTDRHLRALAHERRCEAAVATPAHIVARIPLIAAVYATGWVALASTARDMGWVLAAPGPVPRTAGGVMTAWGLLTHEVAPGLSPASLLVMIAGLALAAGMVNSLYRATVGERLVARADAQPQASAGMAGSGSTAGTSAGGAASSTTRSGGTPHSSAGGSSAVGGGGSITPDTSSTTEKE